MSPQPPNRRRFAEAPEPEAAARRSSSRPAQEADEEPDDEPYVPDADEEYPFYEDLEDAQ